jgi:hypothetical protein
MKYLEFVSIIASFTTLIGFVSIFIKLGREKGAQEVTIKDIRKDVESNALNIKSLENKTNTMQVENARLVSTLSSDLGWIKSSLADIKAEIKKGER